MVEATFEGSEGKIAYRRWDPIDPPMRIVQIVHGYAEHGGRYDHVAKALTAAGSVVYADDHIGHGLSTGKRALITDFDHVVDDLHTLTGIAHGDHEGLPVVLVGHSMGGLLSARYGERWPDEVAGIAFCGAVVGDWQWARDVLAQPELPHVPYDVGGVSRDLSVGASYAADPLVYHGQYKRGLLEAEVAALDLFHENADQLTMPLAVFHGTDDPYVPYERSVQAVEEAPSTDVTIHVYEGARHEVLNETNRDEVIGHLTEWVDRITSSDTRDP